MLKFLSPYQTSSLFQGYQPKIENRSGKPTLPNKKNEQKWTPKDTHHNVSTFIDLVQNDLNKEKTKKMKNSKSNLSKGEQKAMKKIAKRKDVIITNANKGGAVAIMDAKKIHQRSQPPAI